MRFWSFLLSLYPQSFRRRYGDETLALLEQRSRDVRSERGRWAALRFEMRSSLDLLRGAAAERREDLASGSSGESWQGTGLLGEMAADTKLALRRFAKAPGFTTVALFLLALGIGANSTIFSVLHAVVLRPLAFDEPDRLVQVWESNPSQGWDLFSWSHPNYLDHRDRNRSFASLAAFTGGSANLTGEGEPVQLTLGRVTHDFFPTLGLEPLSGRAFTPEDDAPGGDSEVVLLTQELWKSRFGGVSNVVGRTLLLNAKPYTVIGVLPPSPQWLGDWDLVTTLNPQPDRHRGDHRLGVVGRLLPDVTIEQAEADLDAIAAGLAEQFPESNTGFDTRMMRLHDSIVGTETRTALYMLAGAALFVLLIAATNLANLLLARSSARRRELAVSVALGSSRARLLRQLITESTLLALAGGALGLALAQLSVTAFRSLDPGRVPRFDELEIDATIVLFTVALSIVTGIFAGVLPAWQATRGNLNDGLQSSGRSGMGGAIGAQRARGLLLTAEVAVSVVLLVGAGLLIRSFWQVNSVDPGLRTESVLAASLSVPSDRFAREGDEDRTADRRERAAFYRQLREEIAALPEVERVGMISGLPFGGGATSMSMGLEGVEHERGTAPQAYWRIASPGYFETLEIPLIAGRRFTERDDQDAPGVVIVSQRMAERYWPGESAVGKRIFPWEEKENPLEVVGVVADVRERDLEQDAANIVYLSHGQYLYWSPMYVLVRSEVAPSALLASLEAGTARVAPDLPLSDAEPLSAVLGRTLAPRRFNTVLLLCFAAIAIALAAVGIYGVMAFSVAKRSQEIGLRMAMGASPTRVSAMVIGQTMKVVAVGGALGVAAAVATTRLLESLLFGVSPADPWSFAGALGFVAVVALVASAIPARRASRVDAVEALRAE